MRFLDPLIHLQGLYFSPLEDFLPDLEILKPPEEPGPKGRARFFSVMLARIVGRGKCRVSGHKWIRPLKDNAAGKVVTDAAGSRWEWDSAQHDETGRLLRKLHNEELAIEQSDITPNPVRARGTRAQRSAAGEQRPQKPSKKSGARDAGGGFNPYDSTGKPRRR